MAVDHDWRVCCCAVAAPSRARHECGSRDRGRDECSLTACQLHSFQTPHHAPPHTTGTYVASPHLFRDHEKSHVCRLLSPQHIATACPLSTHPTAIHGKHRRWGSRTPGQGGSAPQSAF